jgi:hypothetical protein
MKMSGRSVVATDTDSDVPGQFTSLRVPVSLHRKAAITASHRRMNMTEFILTRLSPIIEKEYQQVVNEMIAEQLTAQ